MVKELNGSDHSFEVFRAILEGADMDNSFFGGGFRLYSESRSVNYIVEDGAVLTGKSFVEYSLKQELGDGGKVFSSVKGELNEAFM